MKREIHLFFVALAFYTRIPCPKWVEHSEENLRDSSRYFVAMGWIVGGVASLVLLASLLIFPPVIAVVLSCLASVLVSGALHEDGLADVCDGFGGGWTKSNILEIMKDSRLGTYGVLGLVFILLLKIAALTALSSDSVAGTFEQVCILISILIGGHSLSRFMAYSAMIGHPYARIEGEGKSSSVVNPDLSWGSLSTLVAVVLSTVPLFCFCSVWLLVPVGVMLLVRVCMLRFFIKRIEGYTGDCLGAIQQVSELMFYLTLLALWKFI